MAVNKQAPVQSDAAWAIPNFRQQKRAALEQLHANSTLIETAVGPIETNIQGQGPVVCMLHGGGGGYDRAMIYTHPEAGFKYIAHSRPGYLRTPLTNGRTQEQQADALAALLDALGIEKTAVTAVSAGGPIGIHFALRHPERCWGLVLSSGISGPLSPVKSMLQPLARLFFRFDRLTWLGLNRLALYAVRPNLAWQVRGQPDKQQQLKALLNTLFPTSLRLAGLLNDLHNFQNTPDYPLEQIKVPTLVIHGSSDAVVPIRHGQRSAARIPNAEFVIAPGGTHLCLTSHQEQLTPAILEFLRRHAPVAAAQNPSTAGD